MDYLLNTSEQHRDALLGSTPYASLAYHLEAPISLGDSLSAMIGLDLLF
jgi:hypothetical protein